MAHINIQGLQHRTTRLANLLQKERALGKANAIDILALTETWEKHEGGSDYSCISKYRYIGFPNKQQNRGTGFLISNKIRDRVSPKSVKNQDPNIGWIQFIDATQTYYIAVAYVPYGIKHQAKQIYQTLMLNCIELQQTGTTIIMGDLNTRSDMTGDNQPKDKTNTMCVKQLNQLIDKANLKMAKNKTMINKQEHWTYKGPVGGLSVPDYILYSREISKAVSNYRLSWEANCDSYHAMQIITIQMKTTLGPSFWNQEKPTRTSWYDANITEYKQQLTPYQMGAITTKQELKQQSLIFINKISEAKNKITKQTKKRKKDDATGTSENITIKLQNTKARLLAQATTKNKKQKSKIWARIHDIQNKIHELEVLTFKEAHQWWWDKLSKINCKDNAREFWKTIKLVRKPNSHEPFPTVMEHEGKFR